MIQSDNIRELFSLNKELSAIKYALDETAIIVITDNRGMIQAVNKKFCEISKYSEEELIGQDHRIINSGYHRKEFFRELWKTIGSGKVWKGEMRNRAKDGSLYWVHTTIVPILNDSGKPHQYISIRIDISKQKQMEAAYQQALKDKFDHTVKHLEFTQKQLQEKKQMYQSLFEHSQDAVFTFDTTGNVINMNPAVEKIIGYSSETLQKMKLIELFPKEYRQLTVDFFEKALKGEPQNFETILYHQNGRKIYLNLTFLPIIRDNHISGIYMVGKDITEQKRVQELNAYFARHDELTKLLNRRGFEEKLTEAIQNAKKMKQKLAAMYIDLDRFKNINDTLGHLVGDRLLEQLAVRLEREIGNEIVIARMGGDEFMVICPVVKQDEEAISFAERLLDCLRQPFFIEGHELYVTASVGISICPTNGCTVGDLMKNADIALYKAKEHGRNNCQIYTSEMNSKSYQSFFLERDLRKAVLNNEFLVHLQPRVETLSNRIISAEALIRWNHPKFGLIPPSDFIPLAEEMGLIIPIGKWMKRKVCEQLVTWRKEGIPIVPISINISAQRFFQKDFAASVRGLLKEYELDGSLLEFEITENSLMRNETDVIQTFNELKNLGIKIYIDDFGTGYSSFSYLKSFKLDGIKIDRSFIHNISNQPDNAGITSVMIQLAHLLKTDVIAEGVETREELLFLREHNCHHVQGYLFAKPSPIEEFGSLLMKGIQLID